MNTNKNLSESFYKCGFSDSQINAVLTEIAKSRAEENRYFEYFEKNWGSAFLSSECFYIIISRITAAFLKYADSVSEKKKSEIENTFNALTQIQNRAAQQYLEILTLIKNGFPDGAFARWRSMYELSVIGSFILKYGDSVAEKFIEASDSQDRYDWAMASNAFSENKKHVTFGDILRLCDIDFDAWKDDYTAANQTVHASPQGTFGRLGVPDGTDFKSQRSSYGIAAPAIQSANTLALISSMLFSILPDEDTVNNMQLATKWLDELIELYCSTHDKLFPDDKK